MQSETETYRTIADGLFFGQVVLAIVIQHFDVVVLEACIVI